MKKIISTLLALTISLSLAGCASSPAPSSSATPSETSGSETPNQETPAQEQSEANGEPIKISFWHGYTPDKAEKLDEMIALYQESNTNVIIEPQFIASGEEMLTKVQTSVMAGQQPDLLWGFPTWTGVLQSTGKLLPLDNLVGDFKSDIAEGPWDVATFDNQIYSVPIEGGTLLLIYNQDMFDEAGITAAPTTWEELTETAKKLTNNDHKGIYIAAEPNERTTWTWLCFLAQNGGKLLTADQSAVGFDKETGKEALQYYTDFILAGSAPQTSGGQDPFLEKQVAMTIATQGAAKSYKEKFEMNIGVAKLPQNKAKASGLGSNHYFMFDNGDTAKQEAVMDFVQWMVTGDAQAEWAIATGYIPVSKSAGDSQVFANYVNENPFMEVAAQSLQMGVGRPSIEQYPKISNAISAVVEEIVYGKTDADAGMDKILAEINNILK